MLLVLTCIFMGDISSYAQSAPRFEASVSPEKVNLNSSFEVVFTLFDGEGSGFRAPDFAGFQVEAGPSTRINASIINGKISRETGFAYTLKPKQAGRFRIGGASVQVEGRTLTTQPISIEVSEIRTTKRGEAFVEVRPSTHKAWVGQQIVLDYVIYLSDPSWSAGITKESDYAGFLAVPWESTTQGSERVEGVNYSTLTERISLYPQKSGEFTVSEMELDVLEWKRDAFSPFGHSTRRMSISAEPVSIRVQPLPGSAPESFTGGVGRFLMKAEMKKEKGSTDETFALSMTIAGNGDMKRVAAPLLPLPGGLQGYEPKVTDESAPKSYQTQIAQKAIEYLITAQQPGRYEIRPEFTYFDTDSARYVTLYAGPFVINVAQGREKKDGAADVTIPEEALPDADHQGRTFPILPLVLGGVALAAAAVIFVSRKRQKARLTAAPEPENLDVRARLSLAAKYLHMGEIQAFYREISLTLYAFCGERFHIPPSEWSKERLNEALQEYHIEDEIIREIAQILQIAETALYARTDQSEKAPGVYRMAIEVIERLHGG